eukprot:scaffold2535_cov126-Cylindrotheca_fusiformis.AAC.7
MSTIKKTKRQTTVLVGGSNGTKTLLGLLGDPSNPYNEDHILRVVTRSPQQFVNAKNGNPIPWKCHEQQIRMPEVPLTIFPESIWTKWKTHLGAAHCVLGYDDNDDPNEEDAFDRALSGIGTMDDGGVADCVVLCCPVYAHLPILKRIARALYRLDAKAKSTTNTTSNAASASASAAPPLVLGSLYAAGGLDWQARLAFCSERPASFSGTWKSRPIILYGLKGFPYLTKAVADKPGQVILYGRSPELLVAIAPPSPTNRARVRQCLERILQTEETGRGMEFLGLGADPIYGGDGSAATISSSSISPLLCDAADPTGSLAFLTCTMNATNQWLHPCIMAALFDGNDGSGTISWPLKEKKTPLPRFYTDGASQPEAGRLITAIACAEVYPLLDCLDAILSPHGQFTISALHGGEPVGRKIINLFGNSPQEVAERSGLTKRVIDRIISTGNHHVNEDHEEKKKDKTPLSSRERVRLFEFFAFSMGMGLSHNHRIGHVLSPAERIVDKETGQPTDYIRPIPTTRFFVDDLNHGLCICLGLGELLGYDLELDMPDTLAVVRKLQGWMGKEFVAFKKPIVAGARDLHETSSPQAFGVTTIEELKSFLSLSPIGEDPKPLAEMRAMESAIGRHHLVMRSKL